MLGFGTWCRSKRLKLYSIQSQNKDAEEEEEENKNEENNLDGFFVPFRQPFRLVCNMQQFKIIK